MDKDAFVNKLTDKVLTDWNTKYIPLVPLAIWGDTNRGLNNYYKKVGLGDTTDDLNIKNTMRHIVGLARTTRAYGDDVARVLQMPKETMDFWHDNDLKDNVIDLDHNELGINYALTNPNFSREDVMNYAYKKAIEDYPKNYGRPYQKFK